MMRDTFSADLFMGQSTFIFLKWTAGEILSSTSWGLGIFLPVLADVGPAERFGAFGQFVEREFDAAVGAAAGREHGGVAAQGDRKSVV